MPFQESLMKKLQKRLREKELGNNMPLCPRAIDKIEFVNRKLYVKLIEKQERKHVERGFKTLACKITRHAFLNTPSPGVRPGVIIYIYIIFYTKIIYILG